MKWLILILMLLVLGCTSMQEHETKLRQLYPDKDIYSVLLPDKNAARWTYVVVDSCEIMHIIICVDTGRRYMYPVRRLNKGVKQ